MAKPRFEIGQKVNIATNHCALCKKLEAELKHPIRIIAIMQYGEEFECRIEDASGAHYETKELCLCSSPSGHRGSPCEFCGQAA